MAEFTLHLDESGDHTDSHPDTEGRRYLGLLGVVLRSNTIANFRAELDSFKLKHFPGMAPGQPVLHRKEIMYSKGAFFLLQDPAKRSDFDSDLLQLIRQSKYMLLGVVVDKSLHLPRDYRRLRDPYHYGTQVMLERYCKWLSRRNATGSIVAEARGKKENRDLRNFFGEFFTNGSIYIDSTTVRRTLVTNRIEILPKKANHPVLQLADLLAAPVKLDILHTYERRTDRGSEFSARIIESVQGKYHRSLLGTVKGCGKKLLD